MLRLTGMSTPVDERGNGPAAVFVHGLGGDLHSWDRIWPFLSADRRSIRYDLRGSGSSLVTSDEEFTHGYDLQELLAGLRIVPCDLVGISMGGGIALGFALDHPELVRSLVLISPQIRGWDWSEQWRRDWGRITDAARAGRLSDAKRLWLQHSMFATLVGTAAEQDLRDEIQRFSGNQWLRDRHAPVLPDIERLHELKTPTLLISGASDVEEFRLMADVLEASSSAIKRVELDGGHLLNFEQPKTCAELIARTFDSV